VEKGMKNKTITQILFSFLLLASFASCDFTKQNTTSESASFGIKFEYKKISDNISISTPSSRNYTSKATIVTPELSSNLNIELWVLPVYSGLYFGRIEDIKKIKPLGDGSYDIPVETFEYGTSSVILIIDISNPETYLIMGFLSLKIDNDSSIIIFPPREDIIGPIEFGEVITTGEVSYLSSSENTLEDNASGFTTEAFQKIYDSTTYQNIGLNVINTLINTDLNTGEAYRMRMTIKYKSNYGETITSSADVLWDYIGIGISGGDETSNAALFAPDGKNLNGEGLFPSAEGPQSEIQWGASISLATLKKYAKPGQFWRLVDDKGSVLASFDLSLAIIVDDYGYPMIPFPMPTYTLKSDSNNLESVNLNWFYFHPDGVTKEEINDLSLVQKFIGDVGFQKNPTDEGDLLPVTYCYRDPDPSMGSGFGSIEGDNSTAYNFVPDLSERAFLSRMDIYYDFALFNCYTYWDEYWD
jgi:hypothetical protein